MTVSAIRLADGTDVLAADATCEGCGNSMADHNCGTAGGGGSVTYTSSRSTGPRKPVTAHPTCPHCGGRVHFNMGGTAINAECLNRQYSLDKGLMSSPNDKLPVLTLEMMGEIYAWGTARATAPTYGKMESASGGAGTYSGLRPKTGRKKKVVAAAPGAQIQDMADDESVAVDGTAKTKKPRKSRKPAAPVAVAEIDEMDDELLVDEVPGEETDAVEEAEEILAASAEAPVAEPDTDDEPEAEAPASDDAEAARAARAERRKQRKALLAGKV